jgi:hypothetical protein
LNELAMKILLHFSITTMTQKIKSSSETSDAKLHFNAC